LVLDALGLRAESSVGSLVATPQDNVTVATQTTAQNST
jgi:hypothetical protein